MAQTSLLSFGIKFSSETSNEAQPVDAEIILSPGELDALAGYQPHVSHSRKRLRNSSMPPDTECLQGDEHEAEEEEAEEEEEEEAEEDDLEEEEHEWPEPEESIIERAVNMAVTRFVYDFVRFHGASKRTYDFDDICTFLPKNLPKKQHEWTEEEFKIMKEAFEETARTGPSGKHLELKNIPEWLNAIDSLEITEKLIGC